MSLKRTFLAAAVAAATLPATAAADVNVYGRLNLTAQYADLGGDDSDGTTRVATHSSRLGVKGSHQISEGLEAIYQAEFGIDVTADDVFSNRNQFIGLKGDFGMTTIGRRDTALKLSQGKVDQFNDFEGDLNALFRGENRASQQISYATPTIANLFRAEVTYVTEDAKSQNGDSGFSVAGMFGDANYKKQPFYAAVAYDSEVLGWDVLRVTVGGKIAGIELGAMYNDQERVDSSESFDGFLVSAAYSLGDTKLKAQYQDADGSNKFADSGSVYSVGAEHKLSKQMRLNAYYTGTSYDSADNDSVLAVGLRYDF
ncbi:porin [Ferrimonas balearica]|uniref:porin n=1 Tax=Ferrimonas balearica TaxID=44012 RepID=UPI001C99D5A1|nr:porin [Ferrimonas balearica]MBY5992770.1 porin [Ferrimonas balearica]